MKNKFKIILCSTIAISALIVSGDSFSLKNTRTSILYGSFENERGTQFKIEDNEWCILSARPGQILFADYPTTTYYGPYDFKNGHIVKLGNEAFEIVDITTSNITENTPITQTVAQPPTNTIPSTTSNNRRVSIASPNISQPKTIEIADSPLLQKRELAPAPSTNPAYHKNFELMDINIKQNQLPLSCKMWYEPINSSKYNWKIGSFNGEKNSEIDRKRIGFSANYNGWFAEAAYSISGKSSGKLVPDGSTLYDLKLDNGKGYTFRGGYNYRFSIDSKWNASARIMFEYTREEYDLTAVSFVAIKKAPRIDEEDDKLLDTNDNNNKGTNGDNTNDEIKEENPFVSYDYEDTSSSITISEKALSFGFGIDRTTDTWGIGVELGFVAYSDLTSSGSVSVGENKYDLEAERSHPIICEFNCWFNPVDFLFVFGEVYLGSDTGLRLGVGKEF